MSYTNAEVAEVLEAAAGLYESEIIEWCKYRAFQRAPDGGKVSACAMGAIALAGGQYVLAYGYVEPGAITSPPVGGDSVTHVANRTLETYLSQPVHRFNDRFDSTKQRIIDAMKDCAKELRNAAR